MRVADYHKQGLQHWVDQRPEGYVMLGREAREGGHRVAFFAKVENQRLEQVKFTASKRCRKLLALADVASSMLRGQPVNAYALVEEDLLAHFSEEKDKGKMRSRARLILQALQLANTETTE